MLTIKDKGEKTVDVVSILIAGGSAAAVAALCGGVRTACRIALRKMAEKNETSAAKKT